MLHDPRVINSYITSPYHPLTTALLPRRSSHFSVIGLVLTYGQLYKRWPTAVIMYRRMSAVADRQRASVNAKGQLIDDLPIRQIDHSKLEQFSRFAEMDERAVAAS